MNKYRLLMNGKNFLIRTKSGLEKHGFYQTIFVESESPEIAENEAVEIIRKSDLRDIVKNEKNDPPMIYLNEIEELESFEGIETMVQGRAFYLENE